MFSMSTVSISKATSSVADGRAIDLYTFENKNNGFAFTLSTLGGALVSIVCPDRYVDLLQLIP
jgi:hypothetical protein